LFERHDLGRPSSDDHCPLKRAGVAPRVQVKMREMVTLTRAGHTNPILESANKAPALKCPFLRQSPAAAVMSLAATCALDGTATSDGTRS
jgi:hypothetical protein